MHWKRVSRGTAGGSWSEFCAKVAALVCTTWGIKGKNLYLLNVLRKRLEYPALKRAVREQQSLFHANVVLIEDKASGTQLIQELIVEGCGTVTKYKPECDKIMRLHAQTGLIENGFVYLPETTGVLGTARVSAEATTSSSEARPVHRDHRRYPEAG